MELLLTDQSKNGTVRPVAGRPRGFELEQVLEQAMRVFWRQGYEGTGLVDLERATGLGRQSLYGVFGDKQGLFLAVVEHYFSRVVVPGLDALDAPGSARANLEGILLAWEATAAQPDFHGCLIGNSVPELSAKDEKVAAVLRRKLELMEAAFARALRRAKRAGEVRADLDPRNTARALLTMAQGLAVVARAQRDPAFVRGVVQVARALLD
jgi:TetR/AcrR family transcriptional regulator, transcriptional repressor for nem operon